MGRREYPRQPVVGVGAVVIKEGKVLLVKRGIPPKEGFWAVPGGSLKLGETIQEGAEREILEETGVVIRAGKILYVFDMIERDEQGKTRFHFVVIDVEGEYISGEARGGSDALEACWVSPAECRNMAVSANTLKLLEERGFFT